MPATPSAPHPSLFLPLPADPRRLAVFRAWAADVRDRCGRHAAVPADISHQAGLLVALLGHL